jgi:hypothetical protein
MVAPPLIPPPIPANMPQLPLPPLPKRPAGAWVEARNPSANLVQKQYVDTRLEELEMSWLPQVKAALLVLAQMLTAKLPPNKNQPIPSKELLRVYKAIERNLQSADLTVNFMADSWFADPNPYDSYTQMYQRAVTKWGQMVLKDTPQNNADLRARADNVVSFPKSWQQAKSVVRHGLMPGRQSRDRIQNQMDTGLLIDATSKGDTEKAWLAGNKHFNPNTKQVFLALNYGRRPHGASHNYGYSYFVAKSSLKQRCMYYAKDTFYKSAEEGADAGKMQFAYSNLGAILGDDGHNIEHFRKAIFESCYEGRRLQDAALGSFCKDFLLEAHHFGDLNFREHVDYMVISPITKGDSKEQFNRNLWATIITNAKEFCRRNGIKLYQTE